MTKDKIKIACVSTNGPDYGGGRAAYRIHKGLVSMGMNSTFYLMDNSPLDDPTVKFPANNIFDKLRLRKWFKRRKNRYEGYNILKGSYFSANLVDNQFISINKLNEADVVILFWIGADGLSINQISQINKPIIWRLSDCWPMTGGCHLSGNCTNYLSQCQNCPQLKNPNDNDLSAEVFDQKKTTYQNIDVTFTYASNWMYQRGQKSELLKNHPGKLIPTGVDTDCFVEHNISNKGNFLIGAVSPDTPHKGYEILKSSLNNLYDLYPELKIGVFGNAEEERMQKDFRHTLVFHGAIKDEAKLSKLYSSYNYFLAPYLEDNLPNTVLESMASGTPTIAMDAGGTPDAIEHGVDGYLAETEEIFCELLMKVMSEKPSTQMRAHARNKIVAGFSLHQQVQSYAQLIKQLA